MLTIPEIQARISPVLRAYDVKSAYIFGSYARGEATDESDVDLRIDKGSSTKLCDLFAEGSFYLDLKDALGCELDLVTNLPTGPLSKYFIASLKKDEVKIYGDTN